MDFLEFFTQLYLLSSSFIFLTLVLSCYIGDVNSAATYQNNGRGSYSSFKI